MGLEIERRFLVDDVSVLKGASREIIVQGYFFAQNGYAARVRRVHHVDSEAETESGSAEFASREGSATITVKGPRRGAARTEYEIEVDPKFAESMLREIDKKVSKSRYHVISEGEAWDVDVFHGDNEGLIIAECEMESARPLHAPWWCTEEITDRREFDNENLAARPYKTWTQ